MTVSAAELHLRRVSAQAPPGSGGGDVSVSSTLAAARALVAVGALSSEAALDLLDKREYERDPLAASVSGSAPFEQQRFVACDAKLEPPFGSLRLRYVSFGGAHTELAVTGTLERAPLDVNASLRIGDDAGAVLKSYFAGSERAGELHGAFVPIAGALSTATRWIEVEGHRLSLGPDVVPPEVRVESLPEQDPALRHLWHVITPDEWTDAPAPLEAAIDALVAVGALEPHHPELAAIREVNAVTSGIAGATGVLPEPWRSLRDENSGLLDGPEGWMVVGAVTPLFDRCGVAVEALESARDGWNLLVRIGPDHATWDQGLDDPLQPPVLWWAKDDRENTYLGLKGSGTSGNVYREGEIYFPAPLDPAATYVDLMSTGPEHRAVIRVPLRLTVGNPYSLNRHVASIPQVDAWASEFGIKPGLWDYANAHVDAAMASACAAVFWPEFIEVRGCVILAHRYEHANFEKWWSDTNGDRVRIESVLTHTHLWDVFDPKQVPDEIIVVLAEFVAKGWAQALADQFPQHNFRVHATNDQDDYGPTIYVTRSDAT